MILVKNNMLLRELEDLLSYLNDKIEVGNLYYTVDRNPDYLSDYDSYTIILMYQDKIVVKKKYVFPGGYTDFIKVVLDWVILETGDIKYRDLIK